MCGIFGFITGAGHPPDIKRLQRLALITQSRGDHAFGLAWLNADGAIHTFKQPGPASKWLHELQRCRSAVAMVGHCRWATHGLPEDNRNNHPHVSGAGYIVHNGVVLNHQELVQHYQLKPQSQCDSEVLALLMARCPGSLVHRSAWAMTQMLGTQALLGIWRRPARLLIARQGRPLHFGKDRTGWYFASLPDDLPGQVCQVADYSTGVLAYHDGVLHLQDQRINLLNNSAQLHRSSCPAPSWLSQPVPPRDRRPYR